MVMLVHIAPESRLAAIRRGGILAPRRRGRPGGVFAVPVTRNFFVSHQWLRELRRGKPGSFVGIYFRLPDEERVFAGHYFKDHAWSTAAEAVGRFLAAEDKLGWQIVIPRKILPSEIHRCRRLPQVVGWRYYPGAHGKAPCSCDYCSRGQYGGARFRKRMDIRD